MRPGLTEMIQIETIVIVNSEQLSQKIHVFHIKHYMRKKKYVKPEVTVVILQSESKILTTSGEYPEMPWGDE